MSAESGTADQQQSTRPPLPPPPLPPPPPPPKKTTRSRVIQACIPCHRSKRKCNRRKPCSQCLKRRITGSCIYEALAAEDLSALEDSQTSAEQENDILRSRIAELEAVITEFRSHQREQAESSTRRRRQRDSEAVPCKDGAYYGRSFYLGAAAAPDLLQQMASLAPNDSSDLLFAFSGGSDHRQAESTQTTNIFQTVFSSQHGVKQMQQLLTGFDRSHLDVLLAAFFEIVDPLHHYAPTPWLLRSFRQCVDAKDTPQPSEAALVFAILGLGDLVSTNKCPNVLMAGAMHLVRMGNFLTSPDVNSICTFAFIAVYLQYEGRLNEFWPLLGMLIRLAQSMGLHRDPRMNSDLQPEEAEVRRRLFHVIAAQETSLSIMFGRPNGLGFCDVDIAQDISDSELCHGGSQSRTAYPFEVSYNRCTWQLMSITREMLEGSLEDTSAPSLLKAKAIEAKMIVWWKSLTPPLKFDASILIQNLQGPKARAQYVQSLALHIIVQHNILVLYRKSLLVDASSGFAMSCIEAAIAIAKSWRTMQDSFPNMAKVMWMHWFRAFHAALICLVAIRASAIQPDIRKQSLDCWNSSLNLFRRLQTQNETMKCCFRALNRLDQVSKKGSDSSSHQGKNFAGSTRSFEMPLDRDLVGPSETKNEVSSGSGNIGQAKSLRVANPTTSISSNEEDTPPGPSNISWLNPNMASSAAQPASFVPTTASPDYAQTVGRTGTGLSHDAISSDSLVSSVPQAGVSQSNVFELDTSNWPTWLTEGQSPANWMDALGVVEDPGTSDNGSP